MYLGLKDWHGCLLSLWLCVHIHGVRSLILCTSENQTHKIELLVSQLGHHTKYSAVISLKNSAEYNTITFHKRNNELKSTGQLFSVVQHHTIECWLLPVSSFSRTGSHVMPVDLTLFVCVPLKLQYDRATTGSNINLNKAVVMLLYVSLAFLQGTFHANY